MRRMWCLFLTAAFVFLVCTGCLMISRIEAGSAAPDVSPEAETEHPPPEDPPADEAEASDPEAALDSVPTPEPPPDPTPEALTEESCAYITAMSMCMDGQTDITFDYVDWLSGEEAREKYLEDYPGAAEEDMEIVEYIGYIRNTNPMLRTYRTRPETPYYLPEPEDLANIVEVTYDTFRDRMFPAAEGTGDTCLTFVKVYVTGETIDRIEWLYTP